jgi:hypothetical protein
MANTAVAVHTAGPRPRADDFTERRAAMDRVARGRVWRGLEPRIALWLDRYATGEQVAELRARLDAWETTQ